jgi:hypothetical protein
VRRYVPELVVLTLRSLVLARLVVGVAVVLLDTDAQATIAFALVTAAVWLVWWLAAGGRRHARSLAATWLEPPPPDQAVESVARTAGRHAVTVPLGLAVALVPVVVAAWLDAAPAIVAGAVSGSLVGLAAVRAVEATMLVRLQRRTGRRVLRLPGPGSRQDCAFFAQAGQPRSR